MNQLKELISMQNKEELVSGAAKTDILDMKQAINESSVEAATENAVAAAGQHSQLTDEQIQSIKALAQKLDVTITDETLSMGSNQEISEALVAAAIQNGKTEQEITAAMS